MLRSAKEVTIRYSKKYKQTIFDSGIGARLPDEYKKFYDEWRNTVPEPVHYRPEPGTWKRDENTGEIKRIENIPLPGIPSKELNNVFTGGEMIIFGFTKKKKYSYRVPRFWVPTTYKSVVYSEILDKYLSVILTKRVIDLIHKHEGFDDYLLQTKACDLQTLVALKLKRKILFNLMDKNLPYNEEKNEKIFEKYKKYLIPPEELEWYGLNFTEACKKQQEIENAAQMASIIPLKNVFRARLIEELKNAKPIK